MYFKKFEINKFHIPAEATVFLSGEHVSKTTGALWSTKHRKHMPFSIFHIRIS